MAQAETARTYVLIAVIFTFVAAVIWLVIGMAMLVLPIVGPVFLGVGLIAFLIAVLIYLTTYERLKLGDTLGARGPCLVWGLLDLVFGFGIGGIFLLLAHSKLSDLSPPSRPFSPAPSYGIPPPPTFHRGKPPSAKVVAVQVRCRNCHSNIPSGSVTCPSCGSPI